jgi:hypothetical protein
MPEKIEWYAPETIELLHQMLDSISPATLHKMRNPLCGQCMAERGRQMIGSDGLVHLPYTDAK